MTEKVRRHPYSIVLLDEIEKAHPDVFNMLLQVMDEGRMTDGNGTTVDFRNTILIMTSNSGSRQVKEFGAGVGFSASLDGVTAEAAEHIVRKALQRQFAPEFLNRLDEIVMFDPLTREGVEQIADLEIRALAQRLQTTGRQISFSPEATRLWRKRDSIRNMVRDLCAVRCKNMWKILCVIYSLKEKMESLFVWSSMQSTID